MNEYDFEGRDFALSNKGIHLLRSRYNYKTIEYDDIQKAIIKRGVEISNAFVVLILGILLSAFALYQAWTVIQFFLSNEGGTIYIETIVLPVIPGILGIYLLYLAAKKGLILTIQSNNGNRKMRLNEFVKSNKINDLRIFLGEKLSTRLVIEAN